VLEARNAVRIASQCGGQHLDGHIALRGAR
jgi:hypothetical protein